MNGLSRGVAVMGVASALACGSFDASLLDDLSSHHGHSHGHSHPGPGSAGAPADAGGAPSTGEREAVEAILRTYCISCHGPANPRAGMDYIDDVFELVANGKILPGDPDGSLVIQRIRGGHMEGFPAPTPQELARIEAYVASLSMGPPTLAPSP